MLRFFKLTKAPYPFHFLPCNKRRHAFFFFTEFSLLTPKTNHRLLKNSSSLSTAQDLFENFTQRESSSCDALFYHAVNLIRASTVGHDIVTAVTLHCLALKVGALADVPTSTSLLIVYARAGDLGSSRCLFNEILNRDVIAWNAMITAYNDNRYFKTAVELFREMTKERREFDFTSLLIVVSALSRMNELQLGWLLHCLIMKVGMDLDSFLSNALIDMYAKCGDLGSSERMFARMGYRDPMSWNSMMTGCLCNGYPEKSLWYFKGMCCSSERADNVSLSCAISACSSLEELGSGQAIHGWGIKLGYGETSHISVANALISLYSRCGDIEAAEAVFGRMISKDVVSWNSMIHGFAENKKILEAFELLHKMQLMRDVQLDSITLVPIISLCAELNLLREGKTVHGFTIRREMGLDLLVTNSLMDMYSKCGEVKPVELLFKAIPERDLVSWNTMIAGYSQNEHSKEAQKLFRELHRSSARCSLMTLLAILPSCDTPEALYFGEQIHCWQLKLDFSNNVLGVNALMLMYINCGYLVASFSLLQSISAIADVSSWNSVIVGCTQNDHFWEALKAFNLMRCKQHIDHDSITLVSILSACGNLELLFMGRCIHGIVVKSPTGSDIRVWNALLPMYSKCRDIESARSVFNSSPERNLCSWTSMISGFSHNMDGKRGLELFRRLEFEPNEFTLVSILSACTQVGAFIHGKEIHGQVIRRGLHCNSFISAALVDMYSKCGRLDIAVMIFQDSPDKSVASWNSMISAYGIHSNSRRAIELFNEMCKSGTKATKSTFVSLLLACSHGGLIDEGRQYYSHMLEEFGVEPSIEHHVCMVDMLGRSGRLNEAYEFIIQMPTQPAPGVWGALLSSCNYHGDLEMGRQVAEHLFGLQPENVGYYVSLSNMYVAAGRWNNAVEIRRMIQDKGLKKPPGCSQIELG